ncbi:hypothetical protein DSO57_1000822 [Entomophthora muscae]|uniref:Uncharacterized protein n=1 Tax=Entomophthora muscae TaxID=34485 RepID=A0ACC2U7D5_9FUNG|nr:hypothetical protein DSO57_1000822 [Entomophthora muscae]
MILPVIKFVAFSLAPFLLLLWSTSPDLWSKISSSVQLASEVPSSLLSLPGNLLYSGEAVVKSLTCDDLDLDDDDYASPAPVGKKVPMSAPPVLEKSNLVSLHASGISPSAPACAPWLLTNLALMALNAYFPQLSPMSSLWSPLQAAVPVLHWTASWWFVLPGWEPNSVSLAPLSHSKDFGVDTNDRMQEHQGSEGAFSPSRSSCIASHEFWLHPHTQCPWIGSVAPSKCILAQWSKSQDTLLICIGNQRQWGVYLV